MSSILKYMQETIQKKPSHLIAISINILKVDFVHVQANLSLHNITLNNDQK